MGIILYFLFNISLCLGFNDSAVHIAQNQDGLSGSLTSVSNDSIAKNIKIDKTELITTDTAGIQIEELTTEEKSMIRTWADNNSGLLTLYSFIFAVVVAIAGWTFNKIRSRISTRNWRNDYLKKIPTDFENHYGNNLIYIQPCFIYKETENGSEVSCMLHDFFLNEVFVSKSKKNKVFLILGDTGMGKTSALVHLYIDYIYSHTKKKLPYDIHILSLRKDDVFECISRIDNPANSILLLDALDENPMANDVLESEGFDAKQGKTKDFFDKELKKICSAFRFVVITCRPQFFQNDLSEVKQVHVQRGESWIDATRLILSPFSKEQVFSFLDQVFSHKETDLRKKAEELVNKHYEIVTRPLVLSFIRDIVVEIGKGKDLVKNTFNFYDIIVKSWLKREMEKIDDEDVEERIDLWWNATSEVAGYMRDRYYHSKGWLKKKDIEKALKKKNYGDFLGDYLRSLSISSNFDTQSNSVKAKSFMERSLLTRTGDNFHFSHKSFYEYFIAYRLFFKKDTSYYLRDNDFVLTLLDDMYEIYREGGDFAFGNKNCIAREDVAELFFQLAKYMRLDSFYEKKFKIALDIYTKLIEEGRKDYQAKVAEMHYWLADRKRRMSQRNQADEEYQKALEIYRKLAKENPYMYARDVAQLLHSWAVFCFEIKQYDLAEEKRKESLEIYKEMSEKYPDTYLLLLAQKLNSWAIIFFEARDNKNAEEKINEALELFREIPQKYPGESRLLLAETLKKWAERHAERKKYDVAEKEYKEALEIFYQLAEEQPFINELNVKDVLERLADLAHERAKSYIIINKYGDAGECLKQSLHLYYELIEKYPDEFQSKADAILTEWQKLLFDNNNKEVRENDYVELLERYKRLTDANPDAYLIPMARMMNRWAVKCYKNKLLDDAEKKRKDVFDIYMKQAEKSPAVAGDFADILSEWAELHLESQHFEMAEKEYKEAIKLYEKLAMSDSYYTIREAEMLGELAFVYFNRKQYEIAEEKRIEALKKLKGMIDNGQEKKLYLASILVIWAERHIENKQFDIAEEEYTEAIRIYRDRDEKYDCFKEYMAEMLFRLAYIQYYSNRYELVEKELLEALSIFNKDSSKNKRNIAEVILYLAKYYYSTNKITESKTNIEKCLELFENVPETEKDEEINEIIKQAYDLQMILDNSKKK